MSTINDGGPAFPVPIEHITEHLMPSPGMSLRDYFAANVLGALIAQECGDERFIAQAAYALADAMLAERNKS